MWSADRERLNGKIQSAGILIRNIPVHETPSLPNNVSCITQFVDQDVLSAAQFIDQGSVSFEL